MDRKVEELTGYRVEEFHSGERKWSDVILEEDLESAHQAFVEALKTDRSYVREYRIRTRGGSALWIQERSHIVCDDRGEVRYVGESFSMSPSAKAWRSSYSSPRKWRPSAGWPEA